MRVVRIGGLIALALGVGVLVWWLVGAAGRPPDRAGGGAGQTRADGGVAAAVAAPLWHVPRSANDPETPDPTGPLRLEGQVIDEAQQPVAGATVVLATTPTQIVVTEADGAFAFEGLLPRTYRVGAFRDGDRAEAVDVRVRAESEPVILHLHPGITLAVTVVDREHRTPIPGATVTTSGLLEQAATTGPDGVAELRGMGSWFNYVRVEAAGYAPNADGLTLPNDPGGRFARTVELARGAAVSGVVLDPEGHGMPHTVVAGAMTAGGGDLEADTDADGRWTIPAVAPGEWVFTSPGEQFAPGRSAPVPVDGVTAVAGVEIRLTPGARIAGVVVGPDGRAVPHAAVSYGAGYEFDAVIAGDDGAFEVVGLPRGQYAVAATAGDRASAIARVDVRTADVADLRLAVAGATITGVVVDAAGEPVAEAVVEAMAADYLGMPEDTRAVTDSAGRWTLGPLSAASYQLQADWPDTGQDNMYVKPLAATASPGDRDVRIVLPAAATIRGAVARGGVPVKRYAIGVNQGDFFSPFTTPQIVANAEGRFERAGLPPGTYSVTIGGADFARSTVATVEVKAGEVVELGTIAVDAGRTVRGRVVDAAGAPVAGATVAVARHFQPSDGGLGLDDDPMKNALGNQRATTTGADGRFELVGIAAEAGLQCLADKPGAGRSKQVALPEGDGELTLALQPTGAIAVTIAGGVDGAQVSVEAAEVGGEASATAYGTGRVRLDGLVPGTYRLRATSMEPRRKTPPATVEVRPGETAATTVVFPTGGVTAVIVPGARCAYVMLLEPGDRFDEDVVVATSQCSPRTPLELVAIPPGDYRVCEGDDCTPITVAARPARQTFKLR